MASTSLLESINPKGHLEIIKKYSNGHEETVLSDHNVITAGLGVTLASLFATNSPTADVTDFNINYFQIGTTSSTMVSSIAELAAPINVANYGNSDLTLATINVAVVGADKVQTAAVINPIYISKTPPSKVTYSLVLEEAAADEVVIKEIGLFSKNPLQADPTKSYLCAYRSFSGISKNGSFALIFKWTLEF